MRKLEYLNGIAGVAPGGTATLLCPVDRRFHTITVFPTALKADPLTPLVFDVPTANPEDIIVSVKQIVNGTVIRELTAREYLDIHELNLGTRPTDYLPFHYSEPWRASVVGEEASSWDVVGQRTFVLEFQFRSDIADPQVQVLASYDNMRNLTGEGTPFASIVRQSSLTFNVPVGDFDMVNLPINRPIQRLHLRPSTGNVNRVQVKADDLLVHESNKAQNDRFLAHYGLATPFAYSLVFDHTQQITDPLIVRRSLNVKVNFSAQNSAKVILETIATGFGA